MFCRVLGESFSLLVVKGCSESSTCVLLWSLSIGCWQELNAWQSPTVLCHQAGCERIQILTSVVSRAYCRGPLAKYKYDVFHGHSAHSLWLSDLPPWCHQGGNVCLGGLAHPLQAPTSTVKVLYLPQPFFTFAVIRGLSPNRRSSILVVNFGNMKTQILATIPGSRNHHVEHCLPP